MKKYLSLFLILGCLLLSGCSKNNKTNIINDFNNKISNVKTYTMNGKLEVVNNDDIFNYNVSVNYKDKDFYRVSLQNMANNHEQIILRNTDGVYVVTPSLNKSFKFQSDWPYNNSGVYILKNIVNDLKNDPESIQEETNEEYIITSKVDFPNNPNLVKQKVILDKNLEIKKVEILNVDGISLMTFTVEMINYKPTFDDSFFEINSIISNDENSNDSTGTISTIDDIIYPLYIPTGTSLTDEEKVSKTDGERVILTFGGDKPFTLVEETTMKEKEFTIVPTYGDPYLLIDTVAALSNNSINWVSNGIEYYIVSDVMNQNELIEVAKSINVVSILK